VFVAFGPWGRGQGVVVKDGHGHYATAELVQLNTNTKSYRLSSYLITSIKHNKMGKREHRDIEGEDGDEDREDFVIKDDPDFENEDDQNKKQISSAKSTPEKKTKSSKDKTPSPAKSVSPPSLLLLLNRHD
jgi:hypothetical protein